MDSIEGSERRIYCDQAHIAPHLQRPKSLKRWYSGLYYKVLHCEGVTGLYHLIFYESVEKLQRENQKEYGIF